VARVGVVGGESGAVVADAEAQAVLARELDPDVRCPAVIDAVRHRLAHDPQQGVLVLGVDVGCLVEIQPQARSRPAGELLRDLGHLDLERVGGLAPETAERHSHLVEGPVSHHRQLGDTAFGLGGRHPPAFHLDVGELLGQAIVEIPGQPAALVQDGNSPLMGRHPAQCSGQEGARRGAERKRGDEQAGARGAGQVVVEGRYDGERQRQGRADPERHHRGSQAVGSGRAQPRASQEFGNRKRRQGEGVGVGEPSASDLGRQCIRYLRRVFDDQARIHVDFGMYVFWRHSKSGTRLPSNVVATLPAKPQVVGPADMKPGKPFAVVPQ
jgi:hypothetical protein